MKCFISRGGYHYNIVAKPQYCYCLKASRPVLLRHTVVVCFFFHAVISGKYAVGWWCWVILSWVINLTLISRNPVFFCLQTLDISNTSKFWLCFLVFFVQLEVLVAEIKTVKTANNFLPCLVSRAKYRSEFKCKRYYKKVFVVRVEPRLPIAWHTHFIVWSCENRFSLFFFAFCLYRRQTWL